MKVGAVLKGEAGMQSWSGKKSESGKSSNAESVVYDISNGVVRFGRACGCHSVKVSSLPVLFRSFVSGGQDGKWLSIGVNASGSHVVEKESDFHQFVSEVNAERLRLGIRDPLVWFKGCKRLDVHRENPKPHEFYAVSASWIVTIGTTHWAGERVPTYSLIWLEMPDGKGGFKTVEFCSNEDVDALTERWRGAVGSVFGKGEVAR